MVIVTRSADGNGHCDYNWGETETETPRTATSLFIEHMQFAHQIEHQEGHTCEGNCKMVDFG